MKTSLEYAQVKRAAADADVLQGHDAVLKALRDDDFERRVHAVVEYGRLRERAGRFGGYIDRLIGLELQP